MIAFEASHINPKSKKFTVIVNFYEFTYCVKEKIVDVFDNYANAKEFALTKIKDREFMQSLAEDAELEDELSVDDVNFEVFAGETSIDSPYAEPVLVTKGYASL